MVFHSQGAAHKYKITMQNSKRRLEWCKARRHWTLEQGKRILWSDESHFNLAVHRTNLGLTDASRTLPAPMHSDNCKVWKRRNNGLGLFFMVPATPLSTSEAKS